MNMQKLLNEWREYLDEQHIRLPDHTCNITFKTGKLVDLIKDNKKVKRLRVPSWSLQTDAYLSNDPNNMASVAYCHNEPIAIVALTTDTNSRRKYGLLNFFVDSWHRGMGLADKLFLNVMDHSSHREYVIASRGGRHMLEKDGYEKVNKSCGYVDCNVYLNKNYSAESQP
jgi:predicted GNAT family acetyltransferase